MIEPSTGAQPTNTTPEDRLSVNIATFNCHGLKSSLSFVQSLLETNDILYVCEHWLRPGELNIISQTHLSSFWTNLKSSMDPTEVPAGGRPYGGCGFICKRVRGLVFRPIPCTSDRISGVEVLSQQQTILSVFGVYMPYDSHNSDSKEAYLETLNELQGYLDSASGPCVLIGDFNTRLPQNRTLSQRWYRTNGFSKRSALLYDLICENDLFVANFSFPQPVNYTWSNAKQKSYIDHILIPSHLQDKVTGCRIVRDHAENTSDHLPVICSLSLQRPQSSSPQGKAPTRHLYPKVNWDAPVVRASYVAKLSEILLSSPLPDPARISSTTAATEVNSLSTTLTSAMHEAAKTASTAAQERRSPRRRHHWWTESCTTARDRMRLYFHIWKSCHRPSEGVVYDCYKDARRTYRRTCRSAVSSRQRHHYQLIDRLFHADRPGKFWNLVKKFRSQNSTSCDAIDVDKLYAFYRSKLDPEELQTNDTILNMEEAVNRKKAELEDVHFERITVSEARVKRLIQRLRKGCASGVDGITAEHICYAANTALPLFLSVLLTVCFRFGCFPDTFRVGRLIPVLKKPHLDPSAPKNYRPITVSVVLSKILELYVLEECSDFTMHPCQFGFVEHRGTTTAISLAHDVASYCSSSGSPVHFCSLDAEGAFDTIPHPVLFHQAAEALPDPCWRLLYKWYSNMTVTVCWNGQTSPPINVRRGTRQGGLSSPFLFNVFYKTLIQALDDERCGVTIGGHRFNVFCYADDVLLASTTVTGLQTLINVAVDHVCRLGLRFNPSKTSVMTFGHSTLQHKPAWRIGETELPCEEAIVYLGGVLHNNKVSTHTEKRVVSAQKAFYGLQSAGLHFRGVEPRVSAKLYCVGVRTVLMYGAEAVALSQADIKKLQKTQGMLVKAFLGLHRFSKNTPLLSALRIPSIIDSLAASSIGLLRSCLLYPSRATSFYTQLLLQNSAFKCQNLMKRCFSYSADFKLCDIFYDSFKPHKNFYIPGSDGFIDSVCSLLNDYTQDSRTLLQLLVSPF